MKEMEKTEEGREVLRKYAKIKEINESLEVLRKHLDDQDESDKADLLPNGNGAVDKLSPTAADRLRTILKLRGVEMSDQEFQALLESDQGQKMLWRIQELQSEEDNEVGAVEPSQEADVEAHDGKQDLELSKKLKELRKLQGLLLSLGNRVEQATAIQDTKGKVVSEEDAAVLREEFARLQKLMGMLQSEVDNVENGEPIDSNPQQHMQEDFEQQQQLPLSNLIQYDQNSPRPKTSRRVPQPTPEEYTDYVPHLEERPAIKSTSTAIYRRTNCYTR